MNIKDELKKILKGEIVDDELSLKHYSRDASLFQIKPKIVVFPKDVEDIKKLAVFAGKNKNISLTPRSGGTDMTGGPLGDSVVVDMTKYFNRIEKIGEDYAIVEPGVYYRDFEKETLKHGLLLPSYPASREICTVGGMVGNNSGGEKTLSYGKTEQYVEELNAVFQDGNEYTVKPLTKEELDKKLSENTFESNLYKSVFELIQKNYEAIRAAKPRVSKNSAGYYLWNVWDGKTFDLTKLLVGSQGTLGIITKIKFRLIKPKKHSTLLVALLKDIKPLADIANRVLAHSPESFESYDDHTLKLAMRYIFQIIKFMKTKNFIALGWRFLPEVWMGLTGGFPKLVLIAEFTGDSEEEARNKAEAAKKDLATFNIKTRVTKSKQEAQKYWVMRRESFNLLRRNIKDKHTAPFIDDFVVRPEQLPEFLPRLDKILTKYPGLIYTIAGHVGDGNFHIIPLMNLADPQTAKIIPELSEKVYKLVFEFKGSTTGEHNDGLIRTPYLESMYGEKIYGLFREVKKIFDSNNIFNPKKKVDADMNYALSHLVSKY